MASLDDLLSSALISCGIYSGGTDNILATKGLATKSTDPNYATDSHPCFCIIFSMRACRSQWDWIGILPWERGTRAGACILTRSNLHLGTFLGGGVVLVRTDRV